MHAISSVVIPSVKKIRLTIQKVLEEVSDSMTQMEGEKDFIKEAIEIFQNTIVFQKQH